MSFFSVRLEDLGIEDLTEGTLYPQVRRNYVALFVFQIISEILKNVDFLITFVCTSLQQSQYSLGNLSSLLLYFFVMV